MIRNEKENQNTCCHRHSGWHGALTPPLHSYHLWTIFYDPNPLMLGQSQLLFSRKSEEQNQSHDNKQVFSRQGQMRDARKYRQEDLAELSQSRQTPWHLHQVF